MSERFPVSVRNGATGVSQDVLVDASPETRVDALLPALLALTGAEAIDDGFARHSSMWVDGVRVGGGQSLRAAGWRPGSHLALHEPDDAYPGLPAGVVELRVVSGPGAGLVHRLGIGDHEAGPDSPEIELPDPGLPMPALSLRVTPRGEVRILETAVRSRPPGAWPPGMALRLGATVLEWHPVWTPDAVVTPRSAGLGLDVHRMPRPPGPPGRGLAPGAPTPRAAYPDPAEVLLQCVGPGRGLWRRRPEDGDFLRVRLGVDARSEEPVTASLREVGGLGLIGAGRDAVARWLVGQAAALHSPRELRIVVLTAASRADQWEWTRWLPQCRDHDESVSIGNDTDSRGRRIAELAELLRGTIGRPGPDAAVLVVLDGMRELVDLPGLGALLRDGPARGIHPICLDGDPASLPAASAAVVEVGEQRLEMPAVPGGAGAVVPDLVDPAWSERVARALAPLHDSGEPPHAPGAGPAVRPPRMWAVPWESLGATAPGTSEPDDGPADPATPDPQRTETEPPEPPSATSSAGRDLDRTLDLDSATPTVIAGPARSGRSSMLRGIAVHLAEVRSSRDVHLHALDSATADLRPLAALPHVGVVVAHGDPSAADLVDSLSEEVARRRELWRRQGVSALAEQRARSAPREQLPYLVVLVDDAHRWASEIETLTALADGPDVGLRLVFTTDQGASQNPLGHRDASYRAAKYALIAETGRRLTRAELDGPARPSAQRPWTAGTLRRAGQIRRSGRG